MIHSLFIADLHLSSEHSTTIDRFLNFLTKRANNAECLYILGDLFDAWIGDDDDTALNTSVIAGLKNLTTSGTKLYFQHGNRDFLIGRRFAKATGAKLIKDPHCIDLYGVPTLLMHGDLLCSADVAYQRFRRWIRNPLLIKLFLLRSLKARRLQAAYYRSHSNTAIATKPPAIMDVSTPTVITYMQRFNARQLIHGHTHKPGCYELPINSYSVRRWVLADWQSTAPPVLCASPSSIQVEQWF